MIDAEALRLPSIAHGFFTRGGGHSTGIFASLNCGLGSGDDPDLVRMNRETVARALGVGAQNLVTAHQIHSADAIEVTVPWDITDRPKVDGLVTNTKGIALGVLTADCGPVLFADVEAGVIGACHAGWKGALTGVTGATLLAMEKLGADRARVSAVLGPTISQLAYEVGPEFPAPFLAQDQGHAQFFTPSLKEGHYMFDLPRFLTARLKREGVGTVSSLGLCTYSDEARFYSYRRATHRGEQDYGRLISAIALV
ncbi:MAG: peptidoglycan editing factor PgeF [Phyllobacteriaceae bacterium]|nr:peptidoglycan editing factor PgeF [Phyllobacteriaceae bacterium]